jgi:hypothetical protein
MLSLRDCGKPYKTSASEASILDKIRTEHVQNTSLSVLMLDDQPVQ